jgi:hypothetical protein
MSDYGDNAAIPIGSPVFRGEDNATMNFCPTCGASLRLLSSMLGVLTCPRGHHWTTDGIPLSQT